MKPRSSPLKTAARFLWPNVDVIRRSEEKLAEKIDALVEEAVKTAEVIEIK